MNGRLAASAPSSGMIPTFDEMQAADSLRFSACRLSIAAACVCFALAIGFAGAADEHPGVVFADSLDDFLDKEIGYTKIKVSKPIIQLMMPFLEAGGPEDNEAAKMLEGLDSVRALIFSVKPNQREALARKTDEFIEELEHRKWEAIATIVEGDSRINVLIKVQETRVEGVTVVVFDRRSGEMVFANIAGTVDLAHLGDLARRFKIEGLEGLGGKIP